jgi:predicted RNA binding protein YcfA (HicA-like mRNA interferase family)
MSKYEKLLEKLRNNPKDVDFKILKKLLEDNGYIAFNSGGSHWVFRKTNCDSITIPYKKPIKIIYVKKVLELIGGY